MIFGYARVSTEMQSLEKQIEQLTDNQCEKIFSEKMTGSRRERPELDRLLDYVREGDTIVVCDLTRLSRSTKDLFFIADEIARRGVNLKSLKEVWLDTTAQGKLMFTFMAGLSQFERDLISVRTKESLASLKRRGEPCGGRPKIDEDKMLSALNLYDTTDLTVAEIVETTGISRASIYRCIKEKREKSLS